MEVRKCTVAELESASTFAQLLDEYAAEVHVDGAPHPSAKMEMYRQLESLGTLTAFGAFLDNVLIGFISVLTSELPHFGRMFAVTESFFVSKEHRGTGAGLKLLSEAEKLAAGLGVPGILVSAPYGGQLAKVLSLRPGYIETNRVFFKKLNHVE